MLSSDNRELLLARLDVELKNRGERRSLVICGGAALIVMNIVERRTRDIDVISPEIDPLLRQIAESLAGEFGLSKDWLNNGPSSLERDLTPGWKKRTIPVFKGEALQLRSLGREDLLATKLFAYCDREDDFEDVLRLKPSPKELLDLEPWVLERDASAYWPKRVTNCFARLKKALKYE